MHTHTHMHTHISSLKQLRLYLEKGKNDPCLWRRQGKDWKRENSVLLLWVSHSVSQESWCPVVSTCCKSVCISPSLTVLEDGRGLSTAKDTDPALSPFHPTPHNVENTACGMDGWMERHEWMNRICDTHSIKYFNMKNKSGKHHSDWKSFSPSIKNWDSLVLTM